jgi:homogentisate 1,2-dioxygenase
VEGRPAADHVQGAYGLYPEQLTGTAFTAPRHANQRTWLYRILPSVAHSPYKEVPHAGLEKAAWEKVGEVDPQQLRWMPPPIPTKGQDFWDGLTPMCGAGAPGAGPGIVRFVWWPSEWEGILAFAVFWFSAVLLSCVPSYQPLTCSCRASITTWRIRAWTSGRW